MTPVTMYQTSDGQLFTTALEASNYEAAQSLKQEILANLGEVNLPSGPLLAWLVGRFKLATGS